MTKGVLGKRLTGVSQVVRIGLALSAENCLASGAAESVLLFVCQSLRRQVLRNVQSFRDGPYLMSAPVWMERTCPFSSLVSIPSSWVLATASNAYPQSVLGHFTMLSEDAIAAVKDTQKNNDDRIPTPKPPMRAAFSNSQSGRGAGGWVLHLEAARRWSSGNPLQAAPADHEVEKFAIHGKWYTQTAERTPY